MASNLGGFGPVVFQTSASLVRNFQQLRETRRARYATHDVLNLEQKLQFVTLELIQVEFSMRFHHAFCVPQEELESLRGVLAEHSAHQLVVGGTALGEFVAEEITGTWDHVSAAGQLLHATAEVRLREYR